MKPLIGDNSFKLSEHQAEVAFGHHIRKLRAVDQERKALAQKRKELLKDAKTDLGNTREIEATLKAMEDGEGMIKRHRINQAALVRAGFLHVGKGDLLDRVDREEEIYAQGRFAGMCGADPVSGYDGGHVDDKAWLAGYKAGKEIFDFEWPETIKKLEAKRGAKGETPDTDEDPFDVEGGE